MAGEDPTIEYMPPVQYSYVCSNHFLPSCFEANIHSQITGQECKRRLKEDAVPSEFEIQNLLQLNTGIAPTCDWKLKIALVALLSSRDQ